MDLTVIHIPPQWRQTWEHLREISSPWKPSVVLCDRSSLPEEDVPEKQPAGIHQQGYERINQGAVQEVVQDALWDDWQVEQPTLLEADGHFLQLLEEKDRKEERAGRAEDDQDEGR